jgi:hypothetical protein
MLRTLLARFRAKGVSSPPPETPTYLQKAPVLQTAPVLQKASVEQIWSSWRYERPAPTSATAAERVNQLKRIGEYETALQVALAEVKLEEQGGRITGEHATVPWYYWEAATIYRKLKRYDEEAALIRRFARNYDIHFRAFSKRYRSRSGAHQAWAAKFLERIRQKPRRPLVVKTTPIERQPSDFSQSAKPKPHPPCQPSVHFERCCSIPAPAPDIPWLPPRRILRGRREHCRCSVR